MTVRRDSVLVAALWFCTAVGQAWVGPATEVKVVGGRVQIRATATPVSSVLDRLSRATGMKVVYEGAPPTDRLTANIDAGSETEALSRLLEGLGLTYAFKLDAAGHHVETLFVTASSPTRRTSSAAPQRTPSPVPPFEEGIVDEPMPANEGASPDLDQSSPEVMQPGAPGIVPLGTPGYAGGLPTAEAGGDTAAPEFPGPASFPSPNAPGAPFPPAPVGPGPASYPNVRS